MFAGLITGMFLTFWSMQKSPNYIIVIPSLTLGGTEKESIYYAEYIRRLALGKPLIVGLGKIGNLTEILDKRGIDYDTIKIESQNNARITKKIKSVLLFANKLRKLKPHTIISMTYWPNIFCGLTWRLVGAKRHFWVQFSVDSNIPVSRLEKLVIRFKPRYLANGLAPAQHIAKRHGLSTNTVSIVRNYLEETSGLASNNDRPDLQKGLHFIMVANFFPEKDHETVLRGFKKFVDDTETPPAHLHFVGEAPGISPQEEVCKALAFDLKLCGHVTFHGKLTDVTPLLQKCHIGILSTRSEGVSNAILEYMLYRLPVIATDILANRDAIGDDNYPYLFSVGDENDLCVQMKKLLKRENLDQLAEENQKRVIARHNELNFAAELNSALDHS